MVRILEASTKEIPLLEQLAREIWHLHYPAIISRAQIEYMLEAHYSPCAIETSMNGGANWFLIENESAVVGFFAVAKCNDSRWKLEKIYLHPTVHNRGIGKEVMQFLCTLLRNKGANTLTLNVNRKNYNSIEAYFKFGFKISKEEDNYLGPYLLDDYVMELTLDA